MKKIGTLALLCLFFAAISASAQTVKVNWRNGAPFASYKTYRLQDSKSPGLPFYGEWVKADVTAELNAKGLTAAVPEQAADVIVTYHLQGQEVLDSVSNTDTDGFGWGPGPWSGGWGWYGGWGGWGEWPVESTTYTSQQPREMLILTVSMADAKHKMLVWRGQATVESVSNSEKGDEKQTQKCVEKMFKSYPPKVK